MAAETRTAATATQAPEASGTLGTLSGLLDGLVAVLMQVDGATYRSRPFPAVSGSIGEHVRHVLDHIELLVSSDPSQALTYDTRKRGTSVETQPDVALRQVLALKTALHRWGQRPLDTPVRVSSLVSTRGDTIAGWSTLARELAFVISHTIHHQALIAVLFATAKREVPAGLGLAPSTPRGGGA